MNDTITITINRDQFATIMTCLLMEFPRHDDPEIKAEIADAICVIDAALRLK